MEGKSRRKSALSKGKKSPETLDMKGFRDGAGGRTRTGTDFTPVDFESTTSANSITPARCILRKLIRNAFSENGGRFGGRFQKIEE